MPMNGLEKLSFTSVRLIDAPCIFHSEAQWRWRVRIPDYFNLWYVISGCALMACDGIHSKLHPGMGLILGPGQQVDVRHDPQNPVVNFAAHFVPVQNGKTTLSTTELPLGVTQAAQPHLFAELASTTLSCRHIGDGLAEQQQEGLVYHLITMLWRSHQQPPPDPIDQNILAHIENMRIQPGTRFSIPELAATAHLSCSQYTRRFTRLTGEPPNRFMMNNRIRRACMLLRDSPLTIQEVADALEYHDTFFFSRQFKKVMDLSPAAYRKAVMAQRLMHP
ncbi:MAG: helix-turn-helix transcriptional regulator [Verrucomicrobia bacterium]|nr:helix-turn-helix transcriptional regulator [Verrucomicrobiota bacterium]